MSGQATAEANGYSLVLVPNMQPMGQQPLGPSPIPTQHPGTAWSQLPASALSALNQSGEVCREVLEHSRQLAHLFAIHNQQQLRFIALVLVASSFAVDSPFPLRVHFS